MAAYFLPVENIDICLTAQKKKKYMVPRNLSQTGCSTKRGLPPLQRLNHHFGHRSLGIRLQNVYLVYVTVQCCTNRVNPFRTAVPFRGQVTLNLSGLSPKRDCSPKRVEVIYTFLGVYFSLFFFFSSCLLSLTYVPQLPASRNSDPGVT